MEFYNIEFSDSIPYEKLEGFLSSKFDLVFAHGTSSLESAKLGIPTICMDGVQEKYPSSYKFKWIFERPEYDVGRTIIDDSFYYGSTFKQLIGSLISHPEEISTSCSNAVMKQYSDEVIINKFSNACNNLSEFSASFTMFSFFVDVIVNHRFVYQYLKNKILKLISFNY